jgi:hypothetical protein
MNIPFFCFSEDLLETLIGIVGNDSRKHESHQKLPENITPYLGYLKIDMATPRQHPFPPLKMIFQ